MKRKYLLLLTLCFLLSVFLLSCGNGPGAPGSSGSEDTGVKIDVAISPNYLGSDTSNVDAFQDICTGGSAEPFTDHGAQVTFTAHLLNPNATFTPGNLHIERYTIEYRRKDDSQNSPPIEFFEGFDRVTIVPPTGTGTSSVTATLMFFDLKRKFKYGDDMFFVTPDVFSPPFPFINNYVAIYKFFGQNDFGTSFELEVIKEFSIGDYDNC